MRFENIRTLRQENSKLQVELAAYLNVKQTTYSKYELGKINIPKGEDTQFFPKRITNFCS